MIYVVHNNLFLKLLPFLFLIKQLQEREIQMKTQTNTANCNININFPFLHIPERRKFQNNFFLFCTDPIKYNSVCVSTRYSAIYVIATHMHSNAALHGTCQGTECIFKSIGEQNIVPHSKKNSVSIQN